MNYERKIPASAGFSRRYFYASPFFHRLRGERCGKYVLLWKRKWNSAREWSCACKFTPIIQRTVIIFPIGVRTFAFFTPPPPPATNLLSIRKIYEWIPQARRVYATHSFLRWREKKHWNNYKFRNAGSSAWDFVRDLVSWWTSGGGDSLRIHSHFFFLFVPSQRADVYTIFLTASVCVCVFGDWNRKNCTG